jgi:DegV family protein with EDD domain
MGRRVRILTDSAADLPQAYVTRFQIGVVPIHVSLNGETCVDDGTLDLEWFYRQLSHSQVPPTTAAPAPQEFTRVYARLVAEGAEEIIAIVTASTLSSLHSHALIAAREFREARVHVVDGTQVSMGLGWLVVRAAELVGDNTPVPQIIHQVMSLRARTRILGMIDSIDHLRRSGRVGWISTAVANLLSIKPLIVLERGKVRQLGRVRTHRRGLQSVVRQARGAFPLERLAILHSGASAASVAYLEDEFSALLPRLEIPVVNVGPAFATHVGPGCVGVAFVVSG